MFDNSADGMGPQSSRVRWSINGVESVTMQGLDARDVAEKLVNKLTHASTFIGVMYGASAEAFCEMSPQARDNYVWGVAELVRECERMAEALNAALHRQQDDIFVEVDA